MIGIPALDEIGIDEETWRQVAYMAEQRQVSDDELLKVQHTAAKNGRMGCCLRTLGACRT